MTLDIGQMARRVARNQYGVDWRDLEQEGHLAMLRGASTPWGAMIDYLRKETHYDRRLRQSRRIRNSEDFLRSRKQHIEPEIIARLTAEKLLSCVSPLQRRTIEARWRGEACGSVTQRSRYQAALATMRKFGKVSKSLGK